MELDLIEFDNKRPVYIQIIEFIKKQIVNENLALGEKIPSVRELAGNLSVNVNTIQKSYKELEREGVTITKRGMGSFVTEDKDVIIKLKKDMAETIVDDFLNDMNDIGYDKNQIISILNERGLNNA